MLSVSENRYSSEVQPRHAHAETTVTILLAGQLRERVGSREEIARPLSIVVKPRDTEHANEFGAGVRTLQIKLSPDASASLESADKSFREWRWHHAGPAVPAFLRVLKVLRASADEDCNGERLEETAFDALAALTLERDGTCHGAPPQWLAEIKQTLDESMRPPSVKQLATRAGVHSVYLARQFRRWFGHSITEHLARRRLQRVAGLMDCRGKPLSLVAYESGFADQSHMCRFLSRETGLTPKAYRALVTV